MRAIAREAGVSVGTVSRVLNGKTEVAPEFVERVMTVARDMNYELRASPLRSPSVQALAGGGAAGQLGSIGYLVDVKSCSAVTADPFQQHFLAGVEELATARGGHVVFASAQDDIRRNSIPPMIANKLVRAVVLKMSVGTPVEWLKKIQAQVPAVLVMHRLADRSIPCVLCDNYDAIFRLLDHLRKLGHRRVGFFSEDDGEATSIHHAERQDAFVKLLPHFGFAQSPGYIQTPGRDLTRGEGLEDVARKGLRAFFALGPRRPTAIVCAADIYAFTIMKLVSEYGVSVPDGISLTGIMNTQPCDFSDPPLTSVSLLEGEIGKAAVDLLQRRMANPDAVVSHTLVGTQLVERRSCAAPKSA
jgi:LacI family transcriptional regulator